MGNIYVYNLISADTYLDLRSGNLGAPRRSGVSRLAGLMRLLELKNGILEVAFAPYNVCEEITYIKMVKWFYISNDPDKRHFNI